MDTLPLLDTHAWVWWIIGDERLKRKHREELDSTPPLRRPFVSSISLWEVSMLVERGRLDLEIPLLEWLTLAAHPRTVRLLPITPQIASEVANLPTSFHRDPADRLIVSTARVGELEVLTYDKSIRTSRLVRLW